MVMFIFKVALTLVLLILGMRLVLKYSKDTCVFCGSSDIETVVSIPAQEWVPAGKNFPGDERLEWFVETGNRCTNCGTEGTKKKMTLEKAQPIIREKGYTGTDINGNWTTERAVA